MKIKDAIEILKKHNRWRRGDETIEQMNPAEIGKAIDTVIQYCEKKTK